MYQCTAVAVPPLNFSGGETTPTRYRSVVTVSTGERYRGGGKQISAMRCSLNGPPLSTMPPLDILKRISKQCCKRV